MSQLSVHARSPGRPRITGRDAVKAYAKQVVVLVKGDDGGWLVQAIISNSDDPA